MTTASRLRRLVVGCLALAACTDPPTEPEPPLERNTPVREWTFLHYPSDGGPLVALDSGSQTGGVVNAFHDYGPTRQPNTNRLAMGEVFSSADGKTYSVTTEDPAWERGTLVRLNQAQSFKKNAADATLALHVTAVDLTAWHQNHFDCTATPGFCPATLTAGVTFSVMAYDASRPLYNRGSSVFLLWRDRWELSAPSQIAPFWTAANFTQAFNGSDARVTLSGPVTIPVDISSVPVGAEFTLRIRAEATTVNDQARESYLSAHFRDPVGVGGSAMEFTGLEPTNRPLPEPAAGTFGAAPECTTPRPGAGTIQFAAPAFLLLESPTNGADGIVVTRTGGTSGAVSATLTTSNGTAVAGTDYTALTTTVAFADGDAGPRTVPVPILPNAGAEPDRTVNLALSDARGCATLGAATSVLTIRDDDTPPPPAGFTIGGTVTGLAGSGLVLRNVVGGEELAVNGGTFTFTRRSVTGLEYDVVVATQPAAPAQVCTVANGKGTMADAAVTNVAVTCATPAPVAGLDPAFGTGGKVATPLASGEGEAVVVQPDGKLVVAGRSAVPLAAGSTNSADFTLLRYNADGTPDASFGTGGRATAGFPAGRTDEAFDAALQADGRIVVVGRTQTPGGDFAFGIARFTADGRPDPSFGTGGLVVADFGAGSAYAQAVVVQPDGRIVVAGHTTVGFAGNDFALARYNADGTPDPSFGAGGKVTTNIAGRADLAFAVALAPGGKIVVAGRAEQDDGRGDDFGLARYNADGTLDPSFGAGGMVTTDNARGSEQANDVAVLPDGRVVAAGYSGRGTGGFDFALARYTSDGRLDPTFGSGGMVTTDLSGQDDFGEGLTVQADGRLVMIGRRTSATFSDLAFTRYLANGTLDAGFGSAGTLTVDFFGAADLGQGVAIQPDGRIVGAGYAFNGRDNNIVLVRVVP